MSILDEIAQKRSDDAQSQQSSDSHREGLTATLHGSLAVVHAMSMLATKEDVAQLSEQLQKVQEGLVSGFESVVVAINEQPDLPAMIHEMTTALKESISTLDRSDHEAKEISILNDIKLQIDKLANVVVLDPETYKKTQAELMKTLKGLDMKPVVNLPAPIVNVPETVVNVKEQKLDLDSLQSTLQDYLDKPNESENETIDLNCYKAQDITDSGKFQYIGFVNTEGSWFIIENNVRGNTLRYVFGNENYAEAFSDAATYEYRLLNEAIDAISA